MDTGSEHPELLVMDLVGGDLAELAIEDEALSKIHYFYSAKRSGRYNYCWTQ